MRGCALVDQLCLYGPLLCCSDDRVGGWTSLNCSSVNGVIEEVRGIVEVAVLKHPTQIVFKMTGCVKQGVSVRKGNADLIFTSKSSE